MAFLATFLVAFLAAVFLATFLVAFLAVVFLATFLATFLAAFFFVVFAATVGVSSAAFVLAAVDFLAIMVSSGVQYTGLCGDTLANIIQGY